MALSSVVFEINGDFSRKFSHPIVFCAPAEGVLLGIRYRRRDQKSKNDGATGPRKKFDDIFSRVDTIHQRDGQTHRQTPGDSKDRVYA